jgi:hypothetical protein
MLPLASSTALNPARRQLREPLPAHTHISDIRSSSTEIRWRRIRTVDQPGNIVTRLLGSSPSDRVFVVAVE